MSEESIAKMMGGPIVGERVVGESMHVDFVGDLEAGGQECLSSTPVKSTSGVVNVAYSSKLPIESPLKRPVGVAFKIIDKKEFLCATVQSGNSTKRSNGGVGSRMVTLIGGLDTEMGLSEMDDMIGQGSSTNHFDVSSFRGTSVGCELPPRWELFDHENFPTRSKY